MRKHERCAGTPTRTSIFEFYYVEVCVFSHMCKKTNWIASGMGLGGCMGFSCKVLLSSWNVRTRCGCQRRTGVYSFIFYGRWQRSNFATKDGENKAQVESIGALTNSPTVGVTLLCCAVVLPLSCSLLELFYKYTKTNLAPRYTREPYREFAEIPAV